MTAERYVVAAVSVSGCIVLPGIARTIVHRESVLPIGTEVLHKTLAKAKRYRGHTDDQVILGLGLHYRVIEVWMTEAQEITLIPLLRRWRGCYGLWDIRRLNELHREPSRNMI